MYTLLDLPDEILFYLVEELAVPFDYNGYYRNPFWTLREKFFDDRTKRGYHLRNLLALSATCKRLRSKLGPIVWGDFVLHKYTFGRKSSRSGLEGNETYFLDTFAASLVETDKGRYVKSAILEFVTVFEPTTPTAMLSMSLPDLYEYRTLELVNKETLPNLQRLFITFYLHSQDNYSKLAVRLQDYERPVKISASMTSATYLHHLQENFWSMVDHLVFTLTSRSNQNRDFLTMDRIKNLKSLTLRSFVISEDNCAQLVRHLVAMINSNGLETLDLTNLAISFSHMKDLPLLDIPSLKSLHCQERHLASFSQSPRSCRSLQLLKLLFDPYTLLAKLDLPFQLTTLCSLEIGQLPYKQDPRDHLLFFRKLQDVNPSLNRLCFQRLTISGALALAPVLSKLKYFKVDHLDYCDTYIWPMMTTETTILATELEHMHVNRILSALILDQPTHTDKIFQFPMSPHELISYPLLKSIALDSRHAEPQVSDLYLDVTWPRVSQFLEADQLSTRARLLRDEYRSDFSQFDFYDSISTKPYEGDRADQSYLQDLLYDFHDDHLFKITDFCYFIRSIDALWKLPSTKRMSSGDTSLTSPNVDFNHYVRMVVKIDLQQLKRLLTT